MRLVRAPDPIPKYEPWPKVFLAGSIEMGAAVNWQARVVAALEDTDAIVLNPRRDEWDGSWVQSLDSPKFVEQTEWELVAMDKADIIAMHFEPETKSPITLFELGLRAESGKLIVHCPPGFWRKGYVDVVCRWFGIRQVDTIEGLVSEVRARIGSVWRPRGKWQSSQ